MLRLSSVWDLTRGWIAKSHDFLASSTTQDQVILGAAVVCLVVFGWRLWRFTITPLLYPDDPKEFPYWTPVIGHLLGFFYNGDALLTKARLSFGDTRDPFALAIAGTKAYVITKSDHVGEVYRNTSTLSFEQFVQDMMRILGNSDRSVRAMFTPLPQDKPGFPNPHGKPMGLLFRDMHIHQLFPGENLTWLETRFHGFFKEHLSNLDVLAGTCGSYAIGEDAWSITLPLTRWCSDYFIRAGQTAYFGPKLAEIDPGITDAFLVFDELSHQVIYQYPGFLAREMMTARDRVLRGLREYLRLSIDERHEDAWFVKASEKEMRAIGLNDEDIAIATMTIYWAINTNSRKAAYWMLAYLLRSPSLISTVQRETAGAFRPDGTIDLEHLHRSVPQLDAMWNEMLRLASFAASVRIVTADTVVGSKILRRGNRVLIPYRQLHLDKAVYGADAASGVFRHERFLETPRLASSNNFRPFGGGATMCPGRHIAKRAVFLFITMLFRRFHVELVGDELTLQADLTKPAPGLMSAKGEVYVKLTPRTVDE